MKCVVSRRPHYFQNAQLEYRETVDEKEVTATAEAGANAGVVLCLRTIYMMTCMNCLV